jgi:hypothetical protein
MEHKLKTVRLQKMQTIPNKKPMQQNQRNNIQRKHGDLGLNSCCLMIYLADAFKIFFKFLSALPPFNHPNYITQFILEFPLICAHRKHQLNRYTGAPAPADKNLNWKLGFRLPWRHQQNAFKEFDKSIIYNPA